MASQAKLRLDVGMGRAEIRDALLELVATSGLKSAYVSMVASRGTPIVPGTRDPRACQNHFYAWAVPFIWAIPEEVVKRGVHISVAEDARRIPANSVDPTVKNYHWGDMTTALFQSLDNGYDTTVLLDHEGLVTEGPGFNIFGVINGVVVTPSAGMLEGISRKTVMEICAELGVPCEARDIPRDVFLDADEVFTATTAGGPVPVTRVNGRILGNDSAGPITARVLETYWAWHGRADLNTKVNYK
jgi:branched-chain amino acid aminotransferase